MVLGESTVTHFIFKHLRRTDKIFKNMAAFIATREAGAVPQPPPEDGEEVSYLDQILLRLRNEFYQAAGVNELRAHWRKPGLVLKDPLISEEELKNGPSQELAPPRIALARKSTFRFRLLSPIQAPKQPASRELREQP